MRYNILALGSLAIAAILAAACGQDLSQDSAVQSLPPPNVLETINTCDGQPVKIKDSGNDNFVLDPGNGSQRYRTTKLGVEKKNCVVGVRFNVPVGYKAQLRLATAIGSGKSKPSGGGDFIFQSGFSKDRPIAETALNTGRRIGSFKTLIRGTTTSFDLQLDRRDGVDLERTVSDCAQRNVWFYGHSSVKAAAFGDVDVTLDLILASFKLIRCN